jgi:hypothetical protein
MKKNVNSGSLVNIMGILTVFKLLVVSIHLLSPVY